MPDKKTYIRFKLSRGTDLHYGIKLDGKIFQINDAPWISERRTGKEIDISEVNLLPPVTPSKIVCVGLNYHAHVDASHSATKAPEQPMLFFKPPSSIIGPGENIVHTKQSQRVDFEAELGIVVGKKARNVKSEDALDYIFGYTCVNDVTARDLQKTDGQWGRAKGFDTFCPVGPHIVTGIDYGSLKIEGILNGDVKQSGNTKQMIFDVPYLISYISSIMSLEPGDLISTGTPSGIEPMKPGDKIEVKVENVGVLTNQVVAHDD